MEAVFIIAGCMTEGIYRVNAQIGYGVGGKIFEVNRNAFVKRLHAAGSKSYIGTGIQAERKRNNYIATTEWQAVDTKLAVVHCHRADLWCILAALKFIGIKVAVEICCCPFPEMNQQFVESLVMDGNRLYS